MRVVVLAVGLLLPSAALAQAPDPQLMAYINGIRAIDNHAHVVAPDLEHDTGYDALPCDSFPPSPGLPPANVRFGPDVRAAWKALYGFTGASDSPEILKQLQAKQQAVRERNGAGHFDWALQQAGIDVVLANRVTMAPGLDQEHFRWVPYDDALLFPLDNGVQKAENPERKFIYEAEERLLATYMAAAGGRVPATLDEYLQTVVVPTLESQKRGGAVAIKFEVAYMRSLDFQPASYDAAADVYRRHAAGGAPPPADYKVLQDVLFRRVAAEAGRLGLALQIHTGMGCGAYFDDRGSDPALLSSVLNDPSLRKTNFVLLHGGTPFDRHNASLIAKPNVRVDTSGAELIYSTAELARIIRPWLEVMPEHVLFGTDAGPWGPGQGWEETTWIGSRKVRRALGLALTQMLRDGVVTMARAKQIADAVLRGNAAELYGVTL